jgi:hypothetical protein
MAGTFSQQDAPALSWRTRLLRDCLTHGSTIIFNYSGEEPQQEGEVVRKDNLLSSREKLVHK